MKRIFTFAVLALLSSVAVAGWFSWSQPTSQDVSAASQKVRDDLSALINDSGEVTQKSWEASRKTVQKSVTSWYDDTTKVLKTMLKDSDTADPHELQQLIDDANAQMSRAWDSSPQDAMKAFRQWYSRAQDYLYEAQRQAQESNDAMSHDVQNYIKSKYKDNKEEGEKLARDFQKWASKHANDNIKQTQSLLDDVRNMMHDQLQAVDAYARRQTRWAGAKASDAATYARDTARTTANKGAKIAGDAAQSAQDTAAAGADAAQRAGKGAADYARDTANTAGQAASDVVQGAKDAAASGAQYVQDTANAAVQGAQDAAGAAADAASDAAGAAQDAAVGAATYARDTAAAAGHAVYDAAAATSNQASEWYYYFRNQIWHIFKGSSDQAQRLLDEANDIVSSSYTSTRDATAKRIADWQHSATRFTKDAAKASAERTQHNAELLRQWAHSATDESTDQAKTFAQQFKEYLDSQPKEDTSAQAESWVKGIWERLNATLSDSGEYVQRKAGEASDAAGKAVHDVQKGVKGRTGIGAGSSANIEL